jgi:hypothetical protein
MARFQEKPAYINQNVAIMSKRMQDGQYAAYLEERPTFCTYFHINTVKSTVDKGSLDVQDILELGSPLRFNKIVNFPIYGISEIAAELQDTEAGLSLEYDGEGKTIPRTIDPLPDDFFIIDYVGKHLIFRVTHVSTITVKSNSYYKLDFTLMYTQESYYDHLEELTVERYHCLYDNIGTKDKAIIRDDDYDLLVKVDNIFTTMKQKYIEKFYDKRYNAVMYYKDSRQYLYDSMLNGFLNKSSIFEPGPNELDVYLFYEEKREYYGMDFEDSIYDRIMHRDLTDMDEVNIYFQMFPAISTDSIFDYYRDERVKELGYFAEKTGPFNEELLEYIPKNFITALSMKNAALLSDPYEIFIWNYMIKGTQVLNSMIDTVSKRRLSYNFHSYVFIPLVLYTLRQMLKDILVDKSVMDEKYFPDMI